MPEAKESHNTVSARMVEALGAAVAGLPRSMALSLGRGLGVATMTLTRTRRDLVAGNLERAFGNELPLSERRLLARKIFSHFGEVLVETLLLPRMVSGGLLRYATHEGWEHLETAVAGGRGAIVFTGHFGNWEVVALAQGTRGIPMDVVGRPPQNPKLATRLDTVRTLTGNRSISKYNAVRPMLRSLNEGRTVGLVIDQNIGHGPRVFVDFFGHKAATTSSLAVLALKTGAPVLPVFGYPETGGHRIVYGPPVPVQRTGNRERDILELTERVTAIIEERVRSHPHLWLWMHNRWRSRPEEEGAPEGGGEQLAPPVPGDTEGVKAG